MFSSPRCLGRRFRLGRPETPKASSRPINSFGRALLTFSLDGLGNDFSCRRASWKVELQHRHGALEVLGRAVRVSIASSPLDVKNSPIDGAGGQVVGAQRVDFGGGALGFGAHGVGD